MYNSLSSKRLPKFFVDLGDVVLDFENCQPWEEFNLHLIDCFGERTISVSAKQTMTATWVIFPLATLDAPTNLVLNWYQVIGYPGTE